MTFIFRYQVALAAVALLAGCGAASMPRYRADVAPPAEASTEYRAQGNYGGRGLLDSKPKPDADPNLVAGQSGGEPEQIKRKIIYTGDYTVDVYDIQETQKRLLAAVNEMGGYMQQQSGALIVIRIPSEQFETIAGELRKLGRIDDSLTRIQAQDVTEEYFDVKLRLRTKENYLQSLYKLLDSAGKLKDKLAVQKEIARVVEEIESLKGRLRFLRQQVAHATVTVRFRQAHSGQKRTFKLPWEWLDELGIENLVR